MSNNIGYTLGLELAEQRVNAFVGEQDKWCSDYNNAVDCTNCEEYLQSGIEAFNRLRCSEQELYEGAAEGLVELTLEMQVRIAAIYEAWLSNCERANRWIEKVGRTGHLPSNLPAFKATCDEVEAIVESHHTAFAATTSLAVSAGQEEW